MRSRHTKQKVRVGRGVRGGRATGDAATRDLTPADVGEGPTRRVVAESLERRLLLTAVVVNTTADQTDASGSGTVSLRDAVAAADSGTSPTTITFDPTVFAAAQTITLASTLDLTNTGQPVTITGPQAALTVAGPTPQQFNDVAVSAGVTLSASALTLTGGGLLIETGGTATLTGVVVSNVNASGDDVSGAGIANAGTLVMTGGSLTGNQAGEAGGGLSNTGTATLTNVTVTGNQSEDDGAGIESTGTITVQDCTLADNSAANDYGGGIYNGGTATLTNDTIANNPVGGGFVTTAGTSTILDCTITGNYAQNEGGGMYNSGGTVDVGNTIDATNTGGGAGPDAYGDYVSLGNNLIGQTDSSGGWIGSDLTGTTAAPLDPGLGALAENGGPTQTLLPASGSLVIDAGSNSLVPSGVTTDQRGSPRIYDGTVDIGAVEAQTAPAAPTLIPGIWQGTVTQSPTGISSSYTDTMYLSQSGTIVTGTERIAAVDSPQDYADFQLQGSASGNSFRVREVAITAQAMPAEGWFLKTFTLQVASDGSSMTGPWSYGGYTGTYTLSQIPVQTLAIGTPATGTFTTDGQSDVYRVTVPTSEPLNLQLTDGNPADQNELYARAGAPPSPATYDYGQSGSGSDQSILIPSATPGYWYVLVVGDTDTAGDAFTISATSAPVILSAVAPMETGTSTATTVTLKGAGFEAGSTVELVAPGGTTYGAASDQVDSTTELTATFAAGSVPAGAYAVQVTRPDGTVAQLPGFTVVAGGQANLVTSVVVPDPVGNHIASVIYVNYSNTGTAPMAAPLLVLSASRPNPNGSGTVSDAIMTLDASLQTSGFWTTAYPAGYGPTVQILASGATPGVLQPGESVSVPVYYAGWLMSEWNFIDRSITFQLSAIRPTDTTPVNWASLQSTLQPASIGTTAWTTIYSNLVAQLGTTSGGYVQLLDSEASYLGQLGEDVTDVNSLWGFAVQQADAADSPVGPTLASAVDASVASVGPTLSFGRSYSETIDGRDLLGPLGFGWSTPWQVALAVGTDGTVTITQPGGGLEEFQPDSRYDGVYFGQTGDTNTLTDDGNGGYLLTATDGSATDFLSTGQLNYIADTNGNKITAGYNAAAQLTTLTASSGQSLTLTYDAGGRIASVTDSDGRQTTYGYDATDQYLTSVTTLAGTTAYAYGSTGWLASVTSPGGTHQYFTYDANGRLSGTSLDGNAEAVTYAYNLGQVTSTDAVGDTAGEFFNELGLVAKTVDGLGNLTTYAYDPTTLQVSLVTDPVGDTERFAYDAQGNLLTETDQLGNTTSFAYGADSTLASLTDAKGNKTSYAYDATGDLLGTTYADGTASTSTFNPLGEPISFVNQNGEAISYAYNAAGQLTAEGFADGTSYAYTYDAHGNLLTAVDATGTTTFTYDAKEELTNVTYPAGLYLNFTYNADGQRTQMVDQTGFTTNYQYDAAGRLSGLTDGTGAAIITYTYDAAGRLSQKVNGNGTHTTYAYNADGNILSLYNYAPSGTVNTSFVYTYSGLGLETTETTIDGEWTYGYDGDGELTSAVFAPNATDPDGLTAQNEAYKYDAIGNRTSTVINSVTTAYATNDLNEYTSVGGVPYTYDADGNLTSDGVGTYAYNSLNQLTSSNAGGTATLFAYGPMGNRISATVAGLTTRYERDPGTGEVIAAIATGNVTQFEAIYGTSLAAVVLAGNRYAVDADAVSAVVGLAAVDGTYADAYTYDPSGRILSSAVAVAQPFQFGGAIGWRSDGFGYSTASREYSVSLGRFTTADPLGLAARSANVYSANNNNPLSFVDPTGLDAVNDAFDDSRAVIDISNDTVTVPPVEYDYAAGNRMAGELFFSQLGRQIATGTERAVIITAGTALAVVYSPLIAEVFVAAGFSTDASELLAAFTVSKLDPLPSIPTSLDDLAVELFDQLLELPEPPGGTVGANAVTVAVSSHDPNDLIGPSGYGTAGYIAADETLPYRIDFENDPTAAAPAQSVTITDPLSGDFDWSTFQLTGIGWGDIHLTIPAGSQTYQTTVPMTYDGSTFDVQVQAGIHADTGQVFVNFYSIDPNSSLPPAVTAGFLPPEDGTGRGQGYVTYLVKPKAGLATGTAFSNVATVSFDNQTTIATDQVSDTDTTVDPSRQATLTIDAVAPTSSVSALPAVQVSTAIPVTWSGSDDAGGSGIATYSVYVSTDGGPFALWQSATAATSATYTGAAGHTYGFYSVATDGAGNTQVFPTAAQATTEVVNLTRFITVDAKHKGTFKDAAGNLVTVTLSGPGSVQLGFLNASNSDPLAVTATGTTSRSSLTIHVSRGAFTLDDLEVTGSLNALNAPTTTLAGTIQVTGTLRTVTLGNVTDGPSVITVDGGGVATSYRLASANGLTITSAAAIASLIATTWTGGGITAPSLGTAHITAGLSNATINLTAHGLDLRSLIVGGTVSDYHLSSAGSIGTATVGGMTGSTLFAGVTAGTTGLPTEASQLTTGISIKSFTDTGRSAFADSDVAAYSIGGVTLRDVTTDNGGTLFGVALHTPGTFALLQPKAKPVRYAAKQLTSTVTTLGGDVRLEVL